MSDSVTYQAIGLMSGTSLDGLDIAYCTFKRDDRWHFELHEATTISYDEHWRERLRTAHTLSGMDLTQLHVDLGILHGSWVKEFMQSHSCQVDFIASHGHTVFHQPHLGVTLQIGSAAHIAAAAGIDVIADFRTTDVAHGGQGAPLVPIGDLWLFGNYPMCLNLGGIANVSVKESLHMEAFDIGLCNMALNHYAEKLGVSYDRDGNLSRQGSLNEILLQQLNSLEFFKQPAPKSLGKEFWVNEFLPIVEHSGVNAHDALHTITEHIAIQIGAALTHREQGEMLVTGGGAHNGFLIERIAAHTQHRVVVPEKKIVDFKEALIFAFLGALRTAGESNALASVTGARRDSVGGAIYSAS
jgi:anhydro-N-acetylmuramic acid kinase